MSVPVQAKWFYKEIGGTRRYTGMFKFINRYICDFLYGFILIENYRFAKNNCQWLMKYHLCMINNFN